MTLSELLDASQERWRQLFADLCEVAARPLIQHKEERFNRCK